MGWRWVVAVGWRWAASVGSMAAGVCACLRWKRMKERKDKVSGGGRIEMKNLGEIKND